MRDLPRPGRRHVLAATTALVLTLTATPAAAQPTTRPDTSRSAYGEIIERAGGSRARIGVLTAASVPESQDPYANDPDRCNSACNGAY